MLNTGVVDGDNKPQEQATNAVRDSELKLRGSKKKKTHLRFNQFLPGGMLADVIKKKGCQIML